ncbi:MAG: FHA domain-containing protein [Bacteriovorax sp.]|nr:FHA domain-containing protein [Bacteriovorax sp.]
MSSSSSSNVRITNELKNPSVPGTHYRFLCMTGPNKGKVYYLIGKRIIIGRGENADIQIGDVKISREHAELSFSDHSYTITDLGAQNGIVVNDNKVKQKKLEDSEKVVIGQTVFKYNIIIIANTEIALVSDGNSRALTKDAKLNKNKIQLKSNGNSNDTPSQKTSAEKKTSPKVLIMGGVVVLVLYVLLGKYDSAKVVKAKKSKYVSDFYNVELVSKKISHDDSDSKKKLDSYIHSGRREFGEGNYFRAMEDFRLALLISPNDGHASFYLSKAKQRLDEDIEKNFLKGKQEYESKKLQASIVSYCSVVQLIQNYPNDERYKNAMLKISAIESELGLEKGEIKCFEEKSADSKN